MQKGDMVLMGRPPPIAGRITDARIAEIDQADTLEAIGLGKGVVPMPHCLMDGQPSPNPTTPQLS